MRILPVLLFDRGAADDAAELVERFGAGAPEEARLRAERSRDLGNALHYCRWRQVARLATLLGQSYASGTIH